MTNCDGLDSWVPTACTLPTVDQPLRVAEFDELFATSVRALDRPTDDQLILVLDSAAEATARDLAERETGCCSFFEFGFASSAGGDVRMTVRVPGGYVEVLDSLAARTTVASSLVEP